MNKEEAKAKIAELSSIIENHNYNYYVSYYKDTFQHGGISMEEMLVPIIKLRPKKKI